MKFLCDRCKTRYSIGDDRVRGKILKIRCKNCANVITVREGMSDEGAVDVPAERRHRPTTAAPNASHTQTLTASGALGPLIPAQKPPAALQEEWYVSIDGEQSGPFSLGDAQRWVGGKSIDADLHCWSEGFDDWLPVDKVSHFRGLRKKPVTGAPPPLPRLTTGASGAMRKLDEEPKPLFAATMASLEKSVGDPKPALPSLGAKAATPVAKTNGATQPTPAIPAVAKAPATAKTHAAPSGTGSSGRVGNVPAAGMSAGAAALAAAFDETDRESGDSFTQVEQAPFDDEALTTAEPIAARRPSPAAQPAAPVAVAPAGSARAGSPSRSPFGAPVAAAFTPSASPAAPIEDDENLEIGEVSRVVKLADLAQMGRAKRPSRAPLRSTGQVARIGASDLAPAASGPAIAGAMSAQLVEPVAGDSVVAPAIETSHRRGTIMLLAFAGVLLAGVTAAVVLMTSSGDDDAPVVLGHTSVIDTSRPEDNPGGRHIGPIDIGPGSGGNQAPKPIKRGCPPYCGSIMTPPPKGSAEETTDPTMKRLEASEVEDYATKQNGGTQRCYMRAQKGVDGILVGDVKKVFVTLSIDKDGSVTEVQLSDHSADSLGKCLSGLIKRWKFRASPGGTYKFALAFASS